MSKNYELVKRIAVIGGKQGGVTKEVNLVHKGDHTASQGQENSTGNPQRLSRNQRKNPH